MISFGTHQLCASAGVLQTPQGLTCTFTLRARTALAGVPSVHAAGVTMYPLVYVQLCHDHCQ